MPYTIHCREVKLRDNMLYFCYILDTLANGITAVFVPHLRLALSCIIIDEP
jgi:hypothetical protein